MFDGQVKSSPEDFDLLERFNSGDDTAFTRIVEKHSGSLINFLFRYTWNKNTSEDIAQETFLRLYQAAPDLKPGAKLSTILYKIACNLAIDYARKNKSRAARASVQSPDPGREDGLPQNDPPADPADAPDALYEVNRQKKEIAAGLAELPETQRLAIILKVYEDRAYAEIAEIMELSVSSVESLLFRARRNLAKRLK
jgi:RNA polymerase sigma-70 factor (ECF subfamily)